VSEAGSKGLRIAIVGDVHLDFDDWDADWFNQASYDWILFTGDLVKTTGRGGRRVCHAMRRLTTPAFVIPGNHDSVHATQMLAEALGADGVARWLRGDQSGRVSALAEHVAPVTVAGYSRHPLGHGALSCDLIVARPHSMGGDRLHFASYLSEAFGVTSLEDSKRQLKALVDASEAERLIFLGHNGPAGLGGQRHDIWGCDFRKTEGDSGDPDLAAAVAYARSVGKQVVAVVAGHMHHGLRGGGTRTWQVQREATLYVNAARVPRIERQATSSRRHHVCLEVGCGEAHAREIWVDGPG